MQGESRQVVDSRTVTLPPAPQSRVVLCYFPANGATATSTEELSYFASGVFAILRSGDDGMRSSMLDPSLSPRYRLRVMVNRHTSSAACLTITSTALSVGKAVDLPYRPQP